MSNPLKLLIVDQSEDDAERLVKELRAAGFEPDWQRVDTEATYLERLQTGLNLVLSDYQTTQFSGLRALELLKQGGLDIPFILVSGTDGEDTAVMAMKQGATDYLSKRRMERLGQSVAQALESNRLGVERRRVEQQLLLQSTALETVDNAVIITDAKGIILWVNTAFTVLTGYAAVEAAGHTPRLLKSGKHPREFYEQVWATLLAGKTWRGCFTNRRKEGSLYVAEHTVTPVRSKEGAVTHFVAVMDDVTGRRATEEALREKQAFFEALANTSASGILVVDPDNKKIFQNQRTKEIFGIPPSIATDADDQAQLEFVTSRMKKPRQFAEKVSYLNAHPDEISHDEIELVDGTVLDRYSAPVLAPDGRNYGRVWTFLDITERKRAEESLRESEKRFRQVVETIHEVFWMRDVKENRIIYVSPGYDAIWGGDRTGLYESENHFSKSIHPEDRENVLRAVRDKQVAGTYDEIYRIVCPDGTVRWIHDRAFPIRDDAGIVSRVVGTAEDITERRKLEDQFRQAQKMEAIGTLAGGIAHDFNNVLAAIKGYTELVKMELSGPPRVLEYLDAVLQGTKRAADLVRQILAFSRQQELERKPIQLGQVVVEVMSLLRATIPATVEFDVSLATEVPNVLADAGQIHQVVMNLCTNAAHAMKGRPGRLTVKLEVFDVDADFATIHPGLRPGPCVRLSVSDTGCGMDAATMSRVFEPFFTTKAPGEGTGLGLAVVHGIMQSHDGAVTVYSHPGEGTTFHLYFPPHTIGQAETAAKNADVPRGSGERVLYVDDETFLATMGKRILERLGYVVDAHTSATEALAAVRAQPDAYDLVVTDQMMPGLTGTDLAEALHVLRADLPIILTTGFSATLSPGKVQAMGISELLLKPISVNELGSAVCAVLAESKQK